jgi:hypothetical protein
MMRCQTFLKVVLGGVQWWWCPCIPQVEEHCSRLSSGSHAKWTQSHKQWLTCQVDSVAPSPQKTITENLESGDRKCIQNFVEKSHSRWPLGDQCYWLWYITSSGVWYWTFRLWVVGSAVSQHMVLRCSTRSTAVVWRLPLYTTLYVV